LAVRHGNLTVIPTTVAAPAGHFSEAGRSLTKGKTVSSISASLVSWGRRKGIGRAVEEQDEQEIEKLPHDGPLGARPIAGRGGAAHRRPAP
jgi:hypothetical protein